MKSILALLVLAGAVACAADATTKAEPPPPLKLAPPTPGWRYAESRRFPAPEAGQGAAADREFVYAINNFTIAKYRKANGERVAVWDGGRNGPLIHMNAGIVHEGRLYCAHSNYPGVPNLSSIEVFDTATLQHIGSHSLGRVDGSLTWIERRERSATLTKESDLISGKAGTWIACFVHYSKRGGEPDRGPEWTQIVEFDEHWQRLRGWSLPLDFMAHIGQRGYSVSGGAFGPRGLLYATGHDHPELYVLDFPTGGSSLKWIATIPITTEGQAFGWDPAEPGVLYTVGRKTREVITGRVTGP
jgi:outer membrane protein assembly factor BamB